MTATSYTEFMEEVARSFEVAGALVLVLGFVWSVLLAARVLVRARSGGAAYKILRRAFGGTLLLGLEILVAADLLLTIAIEPTLESIGALGLIVVIRTFLSFSLEIEIEGVVPWRRALLSGGHHIVRATLDARGGSPEPNLSTTSVADRLDDHR